MPHLPNSLQALREVLSDRQRSILNDVWIHLKKEDIGLPERPLLERYGKTALSDDIGKLSGTVIYSGHENGKLRYNLGLVGIFLTTDGQRLEQLIQRYLLVLVEVYKKNPEIERFSSKDLATWAPDFTISELRELRLILNRSYGSFASRLAGWNDSEFFVAVDDDVVELKKVKDWSAYVDAQVMIRYDGNMPTGETDRGTYSIHSQRGGIFGTLSEMHKAPITRRAPEKIMELDLTFIIDDSALKIILERDWQEVCALISVEAWKSCVLMCGGIIEGLLLWQLEHHQRDKATENSGRNDIRYDGEALTGVLRRSREIGLVNEEEMFLMEWARVYRNVIHPGNERRESRNVGKDQAELTYKLVQVVAANVRNRLVSRARE